jgi:hypothetical protein
VKYNIVRVCARFTFIFYFLGSLAGLFTLFNKQFKFSLLITFLMFLLLTLTGWIARNYGKSNFVINKSSKIIALISLSLTIPFLLFVFIFGSLFSEYESLIPALIILVVTFFPSVIVGISIFRFKIKN